ncbi:DNA methylase N-4/N-6 domain protein [Desulfofundulus kuznetsovii DSM 6115]|uniref:site-specific DNA-methyltransferase (cytosine-N(4)-specific) n=1 Tax=Desulfofundulus kuznetsovii (strain DSM 6115 / VKM B-1805 / 17) TaxID=760568 RepID=A0AAU8PF77_DESK7|nr:DNA methylase N-4/N-6 domain protein [Desulfofundulus kuznetsovii DSM 6115]
MKARYLFKLRKNIVLEGDLVLAKRELSALLGYEPDAVANVTSWLEQFPAFVTVKGLASVTSNIRNNGLQAYTVNSNIQLLPTLVKKLSFIQDIYCLIEESHESEFFVQEITEQIKPVINVYRFDGHILIHAVPLYALYEMAEVIVKKSSNPIEAKNNINLLVNALLGKTNEKKAITLAEAALRPKSSLSPLSHDIHYYKAKFFPRMARSLLNIASSNIDYQPQKVINNFVGSGTTLLEAALLGLPSLGIDIDPLSVMISKAKLDVLTVGSDVLTLELIKAEQLLAHNNQSALVNTCNSSHLDRPIRFPSWLMKNRKMTPEIAEELVHEINVLQQVIENGTPEIRPILKVFLSDAISRKVRMRILGTGSGRFSLSFSKYTLSSLFLKSLEKYTKLVAIYEWLEEKLNISLAPSEVVLGDARCISDKLDSFNILLTSPPYLPSSSGRESYTKARVLSLIGLGMIEDNQIDELIDLSIGSMDDNGVNLDNLLPEEKEVVEWLLNDELRNIKAKPTARYFLDLRKVFQEMIKVLNPGALAIIVVSKQSTFYEFVTRKPLYTIPVAEILAEEARSAGFTVLELLDVKLQKSNRNARPRSLDDYYETLIFLQKKIN